MGEGRQLLSCQRLSSPHLDLLPPPFSSLSEIAWQDPTRLLQPEGAIAGGSC